MRRSLSWEILILMLFIMVQISIQAKKQKTAVVTDITDYKELRKLLKSKTNVLILFLNETDSNQGISNVVRDTAEIMKGQATIVILDCSNSEIRKICKKYKIEKNIPYYLKHFRNGEFHKEYDRGVTVSAMTNFLRDPTGELPWEEDPQAAAIYHLADAEALLKFLKKGSGPKKSLIMFYAPWCGYCKTMKPEYVQAAAELKGEARLAAIDVSKPGNSIIRQAYNISGFPTLLYFEKGQLKFPYNGQNKKQAIVEFMRDPETYIQQKKKEPVEESWSEDSDVVHLDADNFDNVLSKAEHALVVFYAPWCGHCKLIKPEFEKAATRIKEEKINGVLAAVNAVTQPELATKFGVKGYPTLKYFYKGEYKYDAGDARKENQIVDFIKKPQEPPPPPPPQVPWAEEDSAVRHLDPATFRNTLRKLKHALVMFYTPWCGHCKNTKPAFTKAAEAFSEQLTVAFAAVDCAAHHQLCASYGVEGYPSIKYFSYFDKLVQNYTGRRKLLDFGSYIHSHIYPDMQDKKPKTNQESGFGINVVLTDDSKFDSYITSATPTIVMYYASWCGHCWTVKPAFSKLATKYKKENYPINVIAIDAAENPKAADFGRVEELPTFRIYRSGQELATYSGDRSLEDLIKFCETHTKQVKKDEL